MIDGIIPVIKIIDMSPNWCTCILCNTETCDHFAIPVYEDAIVPDDYSGEWGGMPVCKRCYYLTRGLQSERPGEIIYFHEVQGILKG